MIRDTDILRMTTVGIAGCARRENWLSTNRRDEDIVAILRIYVPDLEKMKTWAPPKAMKIGSR